jgi:hypothetical protein
MLLSIFISSNNEKTSRYLIKNKNNKANKQQGYRKIVINYDVTLKQIMLCKSLFTRNKREI